jgi:TRAP-type C4-dicarboxylate transport system permease small subunit
MNLGRRRAISDQQKTNPVSLVWKFEDGLLMLILVSMIVLSFLQIMLRNVLGIGLVWIDPLVRQMLLWVALMGAVVATRDHNHITVDAVSRFLPPGRISYAASLICDTFAMIICALLTYSTFLVFQMEFHDPRGGYIMPGIPLWGSLATLPLAFAVMTLRFVRFSALSLIRLIRGEGKS